MRIPITVHSEPFDIESAQPDVDTVRRSFADYLDQVRRKSTRSKHGLMGPVGKILSEVKSGRRDPASLKGYAIRVHEATGVSPSPGSLENLENGIDTLVRLLGRAPVTFHDRLLDRLDYGLYYDLRKRQAASKEVRRQSWIAFIRDRYGTEDALAAAWDENKITFEELYIPRAADGSRSKKATAKQKDIADFWQSQGHTTIAEGEED